MTIELDLSKISSRDSTREYILRYCVQNPSLAQYEVWRRLDDILDDNINNLVIHLPNVKNTNIVPSVLGIVSYCVGRRLGLTFVYPDGQEQIVFID